MEPNWKPLLDRLGEKRCVGFMFMGRRNGINLYKHGIARMYLNLDDQGRCYVCRQEWHFERADFDAELGKLEAASLRLGRPWKASTMNPISSERKRLSKEPAFPMSESKLNQKTCS